ncbi:MAG TPA: type IX secretion system membrane protein PorP/SprF [Bacteroidales bacterium]|nr:type IX secretion system membrane protein PorP/SprF [Bacteroidales bacterium]
MLKRIKIVLLLAFCSAVTVHGQQDFLFSQYMFDRMLVNPAYAGSSKWVVGSVKNRTQMLKIKGAPQTNIFTFQAPVQSKSIGLGFKLTQDNIAVTNTFNATGFFTYHIGVGNGKLSMGLEGGLLNSSYYYNDLVRTDVDDPAIPTTRESVMMPDVSTGVYYQEEKFYAGASAYHLFNMKSRVANSQQNELYILEKTFNVLGGYMIDVTRDLILEPGFLVKYVRGAPVQADINVCLVYPEKFAAGLSYRTGDAIVGMVKFDITRRLKVTYSYDYTLSPLTKYSSGAHEFGISYGIELLPPPEKRVIHPRYYF